MSNEAIKALELVEEFESIKKQLSESEKALVEQIDEWTTTLEQVRQALSSIEGQSAGDTDGNETASRKSARRSTRKKARSASSRKTVVEPEQELVSDDTVVDDEVVPSDENSVDEIVETVSEPDVQNETDEISVSPTVEEKIESTDVDDSKSSSNEGLDKDFGDLFSDDSVVPF